MTAECAIHFKSVFKDKLNEYVEIKVQEGYKRSSYRRLKCFDNFCVEEGITKLEFTRDHFAKWISNNGHEGHSNHYIRINKTKNFLRFLEQQGYKDIYPGYDIRFKGNDFVPHIYTDDEIERYFKEVDMYSNPVRKIDEIQLPVLFRTLICCGTRITETLHIRKKDVDLDQGIIKLQITKNGKHRYIVLGPELLNLYRRFADKRFYMLEEEDYIFTGNSGGKISSDIISGIHKEILRRAGIPYEADCKGPRIHDFRHTMAVRSFKQLIDSGLDLYTALPLVSAYLGHASIAATEKYVRLILAYYPEIEEKYSGQLNIIFKASGGDSYGQEE